MSPLSACGSCPAQRTPCSVSICTPCSTSVCRSPESSVTIRRGRGRRHCAGSCRCPNGATRWSTSWPRIVPTPRFPTPRRRSWRRSPPTRSRPRHSSRLRPDFTRERCSGGVGNGSATLGRIIRFHRFLAIVSTTAGPLSMASAAAEAGYFDQPHLARDCRAITGTSPTQFLATHFPTFPDMSDPYKTGGLPAAMLDR